MNGTQRNATITHGFITYFQQDPALHYVYFISLCATTVVGNIGNILVIGAVYSDRTLRTCLGNIFIVNLAFADLCVTMIVDPMSIIGVIVGRDFFDENTTLCHFVGSICVTSCVCSLWSITAISVNRYVLICKNQLYRVIYSQKNCRIICCGLWLAAFMLDVPNFTGWGDHAYDMKTMACSYDRLASYSYTVFFIMTFVTIPLFTVLFCNINIFITVRKSKLKIKTHRNRVRPTAATSDFTIALPYNIDDDVSVDQHNSEAAIDEHNMSASSDTGNKIVDFKNDKGDGTPTRCDSSKEFKENGNSSDSPNKILSESNENGLSDELNEKKRSIEFNERKLSNEPKDDKSRAKKGVSFQKTHGGGSVDSTKEYRSSRSKKVMNSDIKLFKTLVIVFIVFAVCWAPYALICLLDPNDVIPKAAYAIAVQFAHSSSSINSVLYAALNKNFRNGYKTFLRNLFFFCRKLKKPR